MPLEVSPQSFSWSALLISSIYTRLDYQMYGEEKWLTKGAKRQVNEGMREIHKVMTTEAQERQNAAGKPKEKATCDFAPQGKDVVQKGQIV